MEIGNFGSFFTLFPQKNQANQSFEIMKKIGGDIIILCMCTKNHNHDVWFLRYGLRHRFFVILHLFFVP